MTFLYILLKINKKNLKKNVKCSFYSPKTLFLAIFANFDQLWMVVYTAMIKIFDFFKLYMLRIVVT